MKLQATERVQRLRAQMLTQGPSAWSGATI